MLFYTNYIIFLIDLSIINYIYNSNIFTEIQKKKRKIWDMKGDVNMLGY